jgi:hypothetical protein
MNADGCSVSFAAAVPAWRHLQARRELLSVTLVRVEAADDQYDLVA